MKKQTCNFLDDAINEHVIDQFKEFNKHRKFASKNSSDARTTCLDSLASVEIDPSLKNDDLQSSFAFNTADYSPYASEKKSSSIPFRSPPPSYQLAMTSSDHGLLLGGTSFGSNSAITEFHGQLIKNLSYGIKKELSLKLDHEQPNESNWKDVADYFRISDQDIKSFERNSCHYKFKLVLDSLPCRYPRITVKDLITALEYVKRPDAVICMQECYECERSRQDQLPQTMQSSPQSSFVVQNPVPTARQCLLRSPAPTVEQLASRNLAPTDPNTSLQVNVVSSSDDSPPRSSSSPIASEHVCASRNSYDAFMLCHEADRDFILNEFLPIVEKKAGLKICFPGRDLAAGSLSYQAQLDFMRNRCRKIVVILSDQFLQDNCDCNWQLNTAVSVDPAARLGKIIPVIYKPITLKHIVSGLTPCDRTRVLEDDWFWDGIIKGIRSPNHHGRKKCVTMF